MNTTLNVGDRIRARGIFSTLEVVGFRNVSDMVGVEVRRVMPNDKLESGQPVWLEIESSGIMKLSSLAELI